jgi:uncharacterized protein (DUF488 family)
MGSFFTLGHSNHAIETWLALVRKHGIEVVVDTRSSPYSKYVPQFDKELMQRSWKRLGFATSFSARNWAAALPIPPITPHYEQSILKSYIGK